MRDLAALLLHLVTSCSRLVHPGGARSVVAESLLLKHQILILNRARPRAPRLQPMDRILAALYAASIRPARQPRFGCRRIAQQLSFTFGVDIDKDVARRILAKHYRPGHSGGPSWLTFLGHAKDSLWSQDLFRCESLFLRSRWVMIVMDQYTRRIVGFAVHAGVLDGPGVCRMLSRIFARAIDLPRALSTDHDPLFEFQRWRANLRILDITEIKSVPLVPMSHPFVQRLIGTIRRELLDLVPFWHAEDLERKLRQFRDYHNGARVHHTVGGITPSARSGTEFRRPLSLAAYRWERHCRGLHELPQAA